MYFTKTTFAILAVFIAAVALIACKTPERVASEYRTETIQVTYLDKPKHWSFDYIRLDDNKVINDGGKHCSSFTYDKFKVGGVYKVRVRYDTYEDATGQRNLHRATDGCDFFDQPVVPA